MALAVTVWILTVILVGTHISFTEVKPFTSYDECKKEGFRQVRDYQEGNIRATFDCDEVVLPPEPCESDFCI